MQRHLILISIQIRIRLFIINFISPLHKKYKTFNCYPKKIKNLKIKFFVKKMNCKNLKNFKIEMKKIKRYFMKEKLKNNNFFLFYSHNYKIQEIFLKKDLKK